jgi:thymidine kinase
MSLDIILGPMFAGKTSRILSIVSRYSAIRTPVLVINHSLDTRYSTHDELVTHDRNRVQCIRLSDLADLPEDLLKSHPVIIVDEAQFFPHLVAFCEFAVDTHGKHVYVVGLDGDSNRRPFGEILQCIPLADRVERLTALCRRCANGTPGLFSYRHSDTDDQQVMVNGSDMYETLCRECYLRAFS